MRAEGVGRLVYDWVLGGFAGSACPDLRLAGSAVRHDQLCGAALRLAGAAAEKRGGDDGARGGVGGRAHGDL